MKKLISVSDVKKCVEENRKWLIIDSDTIITPAAKDFAAEKGIRFTDSPSPAERPKSEAECGSNPEKCGAGHSDTVNRIAERIKGSEIDKELIEKIVREVLREKTLNKSCDSFESEYDPSGLKLVRGKTVICEKFGYGNPDSNAGIKDIVNIRESPNMGAGFMTIERSSFDWELCYEEFDYITDGELNITINGRTYQGRAGDVFFIPKNSKITWSTQSSARFFYVTFPANWAGPVASK